jgi:RNA polymerase-binding protein DksA
MDVAMMRGLLLEERERIERELQRFARELEQAVDEAAGDDVHDPAENGNELVERELDETLEENAEAVLAEIDAALARIGSGTYGLCVHCARPIAEARLVALPYATRCIDCKRAEEQG